jgi:alkanesulfonate monooxygenase SsuD/methylene tetrahydromethanopterin reductase-like flavin-dependent oxidoreductase (luciferase family)
VARAPQGHPVVVQAGASEQRQELAAATADVIYAASQTLEDARAYHVSVKGRMAKGGSLAGLLACLSPGARANAAPDNRHSMSMAGVV